MNTLLTIPDQLGQISHTIRTMMVDLCVKIMVLLQYCISIYISSSLLNFISSMLAHSHLVFNLLRQNTCGPPN